MRSLRSKPWRRSYGYIVRARPREDGALSIIYVNPAMRVVWTSAGEELVMEDERLVALAEQICQERAAVIIRTWPKKDYVELVELYRAPSDGWKDPKGHEQHSF